MKVRPKKSGPKVNKMLTLPRDYSEWLLVLKEKVEEAEVKRLKEEEGLEKIKELVDNKQGILFSRGVDVGPGVKGRRILPWGRVLNNSDEKSALMFVEKHKDCVKVHISGNWGITDGQPLVMSFKGRRDPKNPTTPEKNLVTFTRKLGRESAVELFNLLAHKMI